MSRESATDLNKRQYRFVYEYLKDQNAKEAYIRAGYTSRGSRAEAASALLVRNSRVQAALVRARELLAERTLTDKDYVMDELRRVYERAMQITPVLNKKGEFLGEFQFQGQVATKALELMGKQNGMFKEQHEVSGGTEPVKMLTIVKTVRADE